MIVGIFEISIFDLCLGGVLLAAFMYQVYFYVRYMRVPKKYFEEPKEHPGVTVIVCAHNEGYNLKSYVQSLLTQDYPTYEVIIVDDGSEDNTQEIIDEYAALDKRVRTTFVPKGARLRSTKKLGLTLAAKSAKYDYLLLTDANCRPESTHWISSMMSGFISPNVEVVLGFGAYFQEDTLLNNVIQYDTLFNGVHYLGAAMTGKPYIGVGRNLAYKKDTFFSNGGFADLMTKRAGDDDLFVNKVATKNNTRAVRLQESLTWAEPKDTWKNWLHQKRQHLGVSPAYKTRTKLHLMHEPLMRGAFYVLFFGIMLLGSPLVICFACGLFIVRLLLQLGMLNNAARRLGQQGLGIELIVYDMVLPILYVVLKLIPKQKNML